MTVLAAGSSTQSRARRALPEGWAAHLVHRGGIYEEWSVVTDAGERFNHRIEPTWVLDQGGPVLGFTSQRNSFTRPLLLYVAQQSERYGLYGPGGIVADVEENAAHFLIDTIGPFLLPKPDELKMRWFANGSDACDAAVRLARGYTGRDLFISIGYHGTGSIFIGPPQNAGVPKSLADDRIDLVFGDSKGLQAAFTEHGQKIACIIVEVPSTDEQAKSFLALCAELTQKSGAVFILDDVVTGFRLALGGAAEY